MKWIPTNERMPRPKGGLSLTTSLVFITKDGVRHLGVYDIMHDQWWNDGCEDCRWAWDTTDVVFWLSLPARPQIDITAAALSSSG